MTDYVNTANEDKRRPENLHPFDTRLAYDTYLIDPIAPDSTSYTSTLMNGNMLQHKTGTYSGSANEFVISGGTNLSDKFYFGGTIGIPYFYYKERSDYTETDSKELNNFINNYTITDRQTDNGVGINYKIGMIFRASDILRLGAAYHSPSFYAISRTFTREIQSNLDNGDSFDYQSPKADFTYNLQTPVHLLGSAAIIFGKSGAIDIDYEYVNYSTMKLRNGSDGDDFFNQNEAISKIYRDQHNLRIGGELKLPAVTLRAGFNYSTSPYIDTNYDERKSVSLGLGFRDKNYFYDIGYVYTFYNQEYYLYNPELVKPSVNTFANNTFSVTIGYKF
jgi:long-subunit fatty acid transport protein